MSVIAAYYYNEGKRIREIAIDEHVQLDKSRSGFCWIALSEPTADELQRAPSDVSSPSVGNRQRDAPAVPAQARSLQR